MNPKRTLSLPEVGVPIALLRHILRAQRFNMDYVCVINCSFLVRAKCAQSLKASKVSHMSL